MDESLGLTVSRLEFDLRAATEHARTTPPVLQYNTADSRARLWLKGPKFPRVGIGTQILSAAGLEHPVRVTRTADRDREQRGGGSRHYLRRML